MSGGEYVSLGFFERDDLASVGDALGLRQIHMGMEISARNRCYRKSVSLESFFTDPTHCD